MNHSRGARMFLSRVGLILFLGVAASANSRASDEQRFIGFECKPEQKMLRVSYHPDHLHSLFNEGYLVDTFYLKKNDPSGEFVESVREVVKDCVINRARYNVHLRGIPGAGRLNAACGGETYGGVVVHRNGTKVLDLQFERCAGRDVTIAVTFKNGDNTPAIDTVAVERFR